MPITFARLRDHQHQRVLIHHGVSIAQLTGKLHLYRDAAEPLDRVAARAACVIGRAAGGYDDLADAFKFFRAQFKTVELNAAFMDSRGEGGFDGGGLLHDLLEHKVLIPALFRRLHAPGHAADGLFDLAPGTVADRDGISGLASRTT